MSYFGELDAMIGPGATEVVSSDTIAEVLGGGWSKGRGSCIMWSNRGLEIQHMVRAGHVLINNTAVVNKSIAPNTAYSCVGLDLNRDGNVNADDFTIATNATNPFAPGTKASQQACTPNTVRY